MGKRYYVRPGQNLWYCNRETGQLGTVTVAYVYRNAFDIRFRGKIYTLPHSAIGTRLFFTREGAANPKDILRRTPRYVFYGLEGPIDEPEEVTYQRWAEDLLDREV